MSRLTWKKSKPYALSTAGIAGLVLLFTLFSVPAEKSTLRAGEPAPAFTLTDLSGRSVSLADYRGKALLLDFWATWCHTCETEVPEMRVLYKKFKGKDFELLAASVDTGAPAAVARFTSEKNLPYPVVFADIKTMRSYDIYGLPKKFLIDGQGRIHRNYSQDTPLSEIEADIQSLIAQGKS